LIEHLTSNEGVAGLSPAVGIITFKKKHEFL